MRLAVGIEYDGAAYAGWQRQPGLHTIQAHLESALSSVAAEPIGLTGAGRTDAGVHARWQVAHFETQSSRPMRGWLLGANTELPRDISILWATPVPAHFHARYSAEARTYRYFILNRGARPALAAKRATWIHKSLDHERMAEAAGLLRGEHDFSAFRSSECQSRSPVRRLQELIVRREGEWVVIEATANAFLHHMMRNIVGLLTKVGRGDAPPAWAGEVLAGRDRTRAAPTAPPDGLYLWAIRYPNAFALPEPGAGAASGARSAMILGPP
ncbi:MAG TPA: tRNA pseudouridine(38-40) synthase TruA [Steroidobacteraceae bacterium]|nr:tRNA pseudouridine(38-40) synthase TruA [Steroidobacteraceae bacterium]